MKNKMLVLMIAGSIAPAAIGMEEDLAPEKSLSQQTVAALTKVAEFAQTEEGKTLLKFGSTAFNKLSEAWQKDPLESFTQHGVELGYILTTEDEVPQEQILEALSNTFSANAYCVNETKKATKLEPSIFNAYIESRGIHFTKTQVDLLKKLHPNYRDANKKDPKKHIAPPEPKNFN